MKIKLVHMLVFAKMDTKGTVDDVMVRLLHFLHITIPQSFRKPGFFSRIKNIDKLVQKSYEIRRIRGTSKIFSLFLFVLFFLWERSY